ncbi:discoidin domain-containing protein [Roseobacter sp. HKCCA2468]|uniref:discoidin domain-containing protein n=1 Tax=Roseobacter sp. HKCCA2468 TaxID=3120342 RepID=UPI0030EECD9F
MDNLAGIRLVLARADYNSTTTIDTGTFESLNQRTELQTVVAEVVAAWEAIIAYADNSDINVAPTNNTYLYAGIANVTEDNLDALNAVVASKDRSSVGSVAGINESIEEAMANLAKIEAYNSVDNTAALAVSDYTAIGLQGVSDQNIAALNAQVLSADPLGANTNTKIRELLIAANNAISEIDAYHMGDGSTPSPLTIDQYRAAGITLTNDIASAVNSKLSALSPTITIGSSMQVQELVDEAVSAIKIIEAWNNSNGTGEAPTVDDYKDAGIYEVNADNIDAVNKQMISKNVGGVDTYSEIKTIVDNHIDALEKIYNFVGQTSISSWSATGSTIELVPNLSLSANTDAALSVISLGGTDNSNFVDTEAFNNTTGSTDGFHALNQGFVGWISDLPNQAYQYQGIVLKGETGLDYSTTENQLPSTFTVEGRNINSGEWEKISSGSTSTANVVPNFSSSTSGTWTVSADDSAGTGYEAYRAVDGTTASSSNNSGSWASGGSTAWLRLDAGSGNTNVIYKYSLTAISRSAQSTSRSPEDWTFQGSNNNSTWTTLDTVRDQTSWRASETKTYWVDTPGSYRYYRLNISDNNGDSYTGIDRFYMYGQSVSETITGNGDAAYDGFRLVNTSTNKALISDLDFKVKTAVFNGLTPTVDDYRNAGVLGVNSSNLDQVNKKLKGVSAASLNSLAELQSFVDDMSSGLEKILAYYDNSTPLPDGEFELKTSDFTNAGINGVTEENVRVITQKISKSSRANIDSISELQSLVTEVNDAIVKIEAYNNGDGVTPTALSLADYAKAGIFGVTQANLATVNSNILNSDIGEADTPQEIQSLVTNLDSLSLIGEYHDTSGYTANALTPTDYSNAGVTGVTVSNIDAVNFQVLRASTANLATVARIQSLVTMADEAIGKFQDFNSGTDQSAFPFTIDDYRAAGIFDVSDNNLHVVNTLLSNANPGAADTVSEIQGIVDEAISAIEIFSNYRSGDAANPVSAPQLSDYQKIGCSGVNELNIDIVNYHVYHNTFEEIGSVEGIQSVIDMVDDSLEKIIQYSNGSAPEFVIDAFSALRIDGVTDQNLSAVKAQLLKNTINSIQDIESAITSASDAINKIAAISDDQEQAQYLELNDYSDAGLAGVTSDNIDIINRVIKLTTPNSLDSAQAIQAVINSTNHNLAKFSAYQLVEDYIAPNLQDYQQLGATIVSESNLLTVNEVLGLIDSQSALNTFLNRLVHLDNLPNDLYSLEQVLTSDAFVHNIQAGNDGNEGLYAGSSLQDATPDIIIDFVEVNEFDQLVLVIDGVDIDLGNPTADQVSAGELFLDNFDVSVQDVLNDGSVNLQVKVVHDDGSSVVSDEFTYFYG